MKKIIFLVICILFYNNTYSANIQYDNPQINGLSIGWGSWQAFTRQDVAEAYCIDQGETYVSHLNDGIQGPNGNYSLRNFDNTIWETNTWKSDGFINVICDDGATTGGTDGTTTTGTGTIQIINNIESGIGENVFDEDFLEEYYIFRIALFFIFGVLIFLIRLVRI